MPIEIVRGQPFHVEWMAAAMNDTAWVEWMTSIMGGVPRQAQAAAFPPERFYCLLDELPMHLLSRSARAGWEADREDESLQLNEECLVCPAEDIPSELQSRKELLSGFAQQGTIAWVRDHSSGELLPFWLGPELKSLVTALSKGETVPHSVPVHRKRLLHRAGILVGSSTKQRRMERETQVTEAARSFREKGYAPIANLIHPLHIAALRRYYRYQIRTGAILLGDKQSARRYVAHNEPVARFFHHQIAATLTAIAGQPLKPSYVYLASYLSGAELKKHTDREQCEFSVTLCVDFSPEPQVATPWPIHLDVSSGRVTVYQAIGDGLVYRGTRLPHYRDALGQGQSSTSIFFHYVATDFSGPLD